MVKAVNFIIIKKHNYLAADGFTAQTLNFIMKTKIDDK